MNKIPPRDKPPTEPGIYYLVNSACEHNQFLICQVFFTVGGILFVETVNTKPFYMYRAVVDTEGRW